VSFYSSNCQKCLKLSFSVALLSKSTKMSFLIFATVKKYVTVKFVLSKVILTFKLSVNCH